MEKKQRSFDASRYSTRLIALKFAYLGGNYNGFEHQANNTTPLPTVEEKLFEALLKSRLVAPTESDEPDGPGSLVKLWPGEEVTQYSKGGRTDRGVSAFGQVIGVRVRSNRPLPSRPTSRAGPIVGGEGGKEEEPLSSPPSPVKFDDIKDELPYVQILNGLLPHDIRVLAWASNPPPDFSARFNCRGRHYKYFFSNPAISPRNNFSSSSFSGHLDIAKMQEAASFFLGENDFRNFCKLDASKQINNFKRIIYESSIEEVPTSRVNIGSGGEAPKMYYFNLRGSAFLWHQVRHMIAILFLIGQQLEEPSLVRELLNVEKNSRKPQYEMADDRALVLWECYFSEGELEWIYGETGEKDGLMDIVWMEWHKSRLDEVLRGGLVGIVDEAKQKAAAAAEAKDEVSKPAPQADKYKGHILVDGGSRVLHRGKYIPVMQRARMDEVEVLNEKYRKKKPERVSEARRAAADAVAAATRERKCGVEVSARRLIA
ncbi:pseudouridine synthase [Terfezia boudieri ATCC MYA-4762]|uniref:Pseudouridine synthase n=1 Tax=Terfezia boudieri ATCC MYA-4762 TaxID=1051890 RepID=A0A3N4LQX5_9PEZI|nr:pseudouridine synthase [Terfezia boudieri ATCC MYA-4762]